jgi:hypothetical protein
MTVMRARITAVRGSVIGGQDVDRGPDGSEVAAVKIVTDMKPESAPYKFPAKAAQLLQSAATSSTVEKPLFFAPDWVELEKRTAWRTSLAGRLACGLLRPLVGGSPRSPSGSCEGSSCERIAALRAVRDRRSRNHAPEHDSGTRTEAVGLPLFYGPTTEELAGLAPDSAAVVGVVAAVSEAPASTRADVVALGADIRRSRS